MIQEKLEILKCLIKNYKNILLIQKRAYKEEQKFLERNGKYSNLPENIVDSYLNKALNNEASKNVLLGTTGL